MRKTILGSMTSLLLPLAAYGAPSNYGAYQRKLTASAVSHSALPVGSPSSWQLQSPTIVEADELFLTQGTQVRELVLVDANVQDKHLILKQVKPGIDIIEIQNAGDGVEALVQALKGYRNLHAVHIVAHAEAGVMHLGGHQIDKQTLLENIPGFAAINQAVREGGDLLLYGCDLAQGEAGEDFLEILQKNTHVDVAASSDKTGNETFGGNWKLEIQKGNIETTLLADSIALKDFSAVLAAPAGLKNFSSGWTDSGNTLVSTHFIVGAKDANNTNTLDVAIYAAPPNPAYIQNGESVNSYFYVNADGVDTGTFELTGLTSGEYLTGQFTDVYIVGILPDNSTITSSTINGNGSTNNESFDFGASELSNFSGVQLKGFKLYFDANVLGSVPFFEFRSFTTGTAQDPDTTPPVFQNGTPSVSGTAFTQTTLTVRLDEIGTAFYVVVADGAGAPSSAQVVAGQNSSGAAALFSGSINATTAGQDFTSNITGLTMGTAYDLYVVARDDEGSPNLQASPTLVDFSTPAFDSDAALTAAGLVSEPVDLASTIDTVGEAVDVFDFTITDGGASDGLATTVLQIVVNVSGTSTDAERSQITWRLNGPDASNVMGTYDVGADTITFSGLGISIANGGNETYTINAYFNDNTGLSDGSSVVLSIDGDTDITVGGSGTQMAGGQAAVTNGTGTSIDVTATQLVFITQPSGSVSGAALTTQPAIAATDDFGNTDVGFTETITLTEASAGGLVNNTQVATAGVATFTNLIYTATTDQQAFTLTANDQDGIGSDLPTVDASPVISDVVATQLIFTTQPSPISVENDITTSFATVPVVTAVDANSITDTGYATAFVLAEVNGAGSATLTGAGDEDASSTTVTLTPSSGVATFTGLQIAYAASGSANETFNLRVSSGGLSTADSAQLTAIVPPNISSVGVPSNGTYASGDTLSLTVNTSEAVMVNTVGGTPRIALTIGTDTVYAEYASGSGTSALVFTYTVTAGDLDSDGIALAGAVEANGGTLQDSDNNDLNPTLNAVGSTASVLVDAVAPTISSVSVPAADTYLAGETLSFTVNTTENVTVSGTPNLPLTIGATVREAGYVSGSGTSALIFSYTIQAGDNDSDGIAIGASVVLDGGTMSDAAGNDLTLSLNTVGDTSGVLVDTAAPTMQSLNPTDDLATVATNANFVMTFSEDIAPGTGNITIYDSLNAPIVTIDVTSHGGQLSITGNELTINPAADLSEGTSYYIQIDNGAVTDLAGIAYAGIVDSTSWSFTVADITPPTATIVVNDTELLAGESSSVTITFSEAVSGFGVADLEVVNGSLDTLETGDNVTWTATFTPEPDTYTLNNVITLNNTGVVDAANNTGSGTTVSNEFTVRTLALTLLVTGSFDDGDDETTAATLDEDEADGYGLSLREALFWARSNGDTITFDLSSGIEGNQGGTILLNGAHLVVNQNNLTIDGDLDDDGSPDVTISGTNNSMVMSVATNTSDVELIGLTLTEGSGGGLELLSNASVTVRDAHITNNSGGGWGGSGGGIFGSNGTLTVINSTVSNNINASSGGGISINGGVLHVFNSTISNNRTTGPEVTGGGIRYTGPDLLLVNTTISGNLADDSQAEGGGLGITSGSFATVYNSTIVGNASTNVGGGVLAGGTTDIFVNTVIAGNTAGAGATAAISGSPLATGGVASDVVGTIEMAINSYFGTTATITTDTNSLNNQGTLDLLLGDLADNGGSVMTHRPMAGSVLSDAGSTADLPPDTYDLDGDTNVAEALPVDALGVSRVSGAAVDIGAVEGNRAPVLLDLNGGNTYIEDGVAVVIDNDITVTDDELDELNGGNGNYSGASVTIARNGGADASDTFGFVDGSGINLVSGELIKNGQVIAIFDTATAGQLVVTYTDANGELPERFDVNAIMQQITYANTTNDPDISVVLDWTFRDEAGASVTETASVTISQKNDAPVVTATGGTPTFTENGTAVDLFSAVSISPVEAAQSIISLQLTVTGANNGSDEILAIDGSDVALTQGNALVTAINGLDVSVAVAGTTATVTLSHATGITGAAAQAVVDGMTYRNTSENPNPLNRVVTLSSIQDNGGVANSGADTAAPAIAATVTISAVNNAPTITGTPATVTDQNALYNFTPSAADVDSDTLSFSIANQPTWASFDGATGTLSGVPSQANVGVSSNIVITVSDGSESASLPAFSLTVVDVNDAPVISGMPATSLDQDTPYLFTPTASDLDGDDLTFSVANQPAWASFDPATGTLAGTPDVDDVGIYPNIIITVSDGALTADLPSFSIEVLATNVAPEISGTPSLTAYVGAAYSFTPTASDADDDELTFSALGLPSWLALNTTTGQLNGTPGAADADMAYNIALSVSDGIETVTLPVFTLTVEYDGAEPVVTPPEDITINAIGLYTPISLRQLLSLPPGTSASVVQETLRDLASDSSGGEDCCITQPQGLLANLILLPPGRHEIIWRATNPDGLTGEAVQVVNVRPRVAFGKHQVAVENTSVQVRVILNGRSPFYPLEVPYVIDPASTALLGIDHDAMDGSVTFTEGQTEVSFTVNLLPGGTPGDTRLIIRLDDDSPRSNEPIPNYDPANPDIRDINAGAADHHFINIIDGNVIPKVNLVMNQAGANTILVGAGSGPVTATAVVTDPNPGDTHSFNWASTDSRLSDTDGSATNNTFVFDPSGQVGLRKLEVMTTDSAGGVDISHLYFLIVPSLPTLDAGTDTDEDGVDDLTEGTSDSNSNGIPDYLDNMPSSNVLPQVIIGTTSYLIECDPGVLCGLGQFALGGESGGVQILNEELGVTEGLVADEDFEPAGGIFDFVIRDLPTAGQSVRIVIPQQAPIPANAVYRKFQSGEWVNFVENADNTLHSAPGNPGYCPPPGDDTWAPGLVEGYLCVQLNIQDGGPNDADGIVNSAIADPGAVSSAKPVEPPPPPPPPPATSIDSEGKGGGALDWTWLLFGGVLLVLRRYGSKKPAALLLVVALFSGASQAQTEAGDTYLRLNVYQAKGNQSASDFSGDMAGGGMALSLRDYDVSRVAYRLSFGYQWTEATSVELGYLDLGDVTVNFDTTATDMATLTRALEEHYPMSADGFTLSHRFGHHFTSGLSLSGEVGIFMWEGKIDVDGAVIDPDLGSGIDPLLGVQLDYRLAKSVSIGLGYQHIFFDGQAVDLMGVSGIWHF